MSELRLQESLSTWRQWAQEKPLIIEQFNGGITNQSFLISIQNRKYVIRLNAVNSEELNIDRALEVRALSIASKNFLAPCPFYVDPQFAFLITEYVEGQVWDSGDLLFAERVSKLAKLLASIHNLDTIDGRLSIKRKVDNYKNLLAYKCSRLDKLEAEIAPIIKMISKKDEFSCLCHNDLLVANIIETPAGGLVALDWEYAAMGSPYFDLAVVIEGQAFSSKLVDYFIGEYTRASSVSIDPELLMQWRIVYCYLDCLWYAVQQFSVQRYSAVDSAVKVEEVAMGEMIIEKMAYLEKLLS